MSGRCSPPPSGGHSAFTDRPTVPELKELLSELVDWRRFGAHLPGITRKMIDTLGRHGDQSIGSRKDALFTKWLRAYEKASWMDVITTLFISGEFKLLSSVADDIKRRYTSSKHVGQTTSESSQADNVPPSDVELRRKDAKRSITRNIDKLTDVISSSVSSFQATVLGCEAKELIPTSFKSRLLDTLTGLDTQSRVTEFLSFIQNFVSLNSSYLDVFLTVLITNYAKTGKEIAGDVAKEYGHKLPQYDERVAAKPVIGLAVGGAVSSNDTASRSKITLISESQVKEDIKSLYQSFASLVKSIRCSLIVSGNSVDDIAIYIKAIIGPLDLTQGTTIDELFDKIQPHYSFLDCELLEAIVNEFLSAENELQIELTQYIEKVNKFTESSCLLHIKTAIEKFLISKQDVTDTTCRVVIKLNKKWGGITLKHFKYVIEYLFPTRKNILSHIHIEGGSIIISFIAPLSQSQYLVDNVLSKKNFLQRIGIIEISINDQSILPARVDDINLNQSLLEASEEGDQLGVSILLQLGASINYRNGERKTSLMLACSGGHEHVVQTLLSANADVNSHDWMGYTALMRAVESHSIRIVSSLLEHNADPNKAILYTDCNNNSNTALIMACTSCQIDVVKLLLSYNADVSIFDYKALEVSTKTDDHLYILYQLMPLVPEFIVRFMLIFALEYGQLQIIATLLKHLDPNITNEQLHLSVSCCKGDYRTVMQLLHHPNINLGYPLLPPLILASSCGHLPIVELLLEQQIPVDIKTFFNYTSLMYASVNGHLNVVDLLLKERQADVNAERFDGHTALMSASRNGHHHIVELLLKNNADVETCDVNGYTALILASQNGHHQVVELLLNHHADVNTVTINGCSALILACESGHFEVVELLLKQHIDINILDNNGTVPLLVACQNGHHQVVELLLNKHADVNIQNNKLGYTALFIAGQNGHHQVVELLLNKHADVNVQNNNYGYTALLAASQNGHHQVVELLLKHHSNVNIQNKHGITALMAASQCGHYQVVKLLLNQHADVYICDNNGCTALILASKNNHHQVVELLLKEHVSVDVDICDNNSMTALMYASFSGYHQVVELLLKEYAGVNIHDNNGYTALILASLGGHHQVVELLLKEHADVNISNIDGYTALIFACAQNHQEVVKLLLTRPINDSDKWLSIILARKSGKDEIVEILLDELNTSQVDSSKTTGFKPVYNELISKSEDQDDCTIQPVTQSPLDPFMLNQKEKEILMKNLTARKIKSSSTLTPPTDVEFLMRHQPKTFTSISPSPLTTLPLEHSRVM